MEEPAPWNSQPLDEWRVKYAKGKLIDLDGHSTHYVEKGDGKPVILLHGWFHDLQMWSKNMDSLAQTFKIASTKRDNPCPLNFPPIYFTTWSLAASSIPKVLLVSSSEVSPIVL